MCLDRDLDLGWLGWLAELCLGGGWPGWLAGLAGWAGWPATNLPKEVNYLCNLQNLMNASKTCENQMLLQVFENRPSRNSKNP